MERVNDRLKFNVPVHFAFAKSELREADRPVLDRFAAVVREYYPGALVTIEGFTDPSGSAAFNQWLGQRRADAVKEYLATAGGLETGELKAVSYGESRNRQVVPGAKGPGDLGLENRRVALVIDHAVIATDQIAMP
jgi:peptidoglycan-associated lipoprotein